MAAQVLRGLIAQYKPELCEAFEANMGYQPMVPSLVSLVPADGFCEQVLRQYRASKAAGLQEVRLSDDVAVEREVGELRGPEGQ